MQPETPATGAADRVELRVCPEVAAFALLMERELRANDHKPGWKDDDESDLSARVVEKARELDAVASAGQRTTWKAYQDKIASEAANVANFCMMIADVCGCLDLAALKPSPGAGAAGLEEVERLASKLRLFGAATRAYAKAGPDTAARVNGERHADRLEREILATIARQADDLERLRKLDKALEEVKVASVDAAPGPWLAEATGGRGAWIKGSNGEWSALSCADSDARADANGVLIVAAVNLVLAQIARPSADQREGADEGGGRL